MDSLIKQLREYFSKVDWPLFLVLVLNVKLIVKLVAIILVSLWQFRRINFSDLKEHKLLLFYASMIIIALLNLVLQSSSLTTNYLVAAGLGIFFWMLAAITSFLLFSFVKRTAPAILHHTITIFFILHILTVFINLLRIMIETGSINPYTFKGLNQKYYISTGDFISGISFDSPVTTALISAFALLYFLFKKNYGLSLAAMASMLIIGSNLTNLCVIIILAIIFVIRSSAVQNKRIEKGDFVGMRD